MIFKLFLIGIKVQDMHCFSAIFTGSFNVIYTIIHDGIQRWTEGAEGYGAAYCILLRSG